MKDRTPAEQARAATCHFWASLDELAAKKKIGRKMLYKELKAQLKIGSITDLDTEEIDDLAMEMEATAAHL